MAFFRTVLYYLIQIFTDIMLIRAITSWFPSARSIYQFFVTLTEPIINPVRKLLNRIEAIQNCPIDIAFLVTWILLDILANMLYV